MSENRYFDILEKVYQLTNNTTPRSFDCGELCGKKCCGNLSEYSHKSGMCLLPYEKEFLLSKGAKYEYDSGDDGEVLICNGSCKRELRPFACRIFPYCVEITNSRIKLTKDLRAAQVCPLLFDKISKRADIYFIRSIKKAARLMSKEPLFKKELLKISDFNSYLYEFYKKMEK